MSFSTSIFIENSCTYEEFVSAIEKTLQVDFTKAKHEPWPISTFIGLGLEIVLVGDLDYDDDLGIPFSRYCYQIRVEIRHRVKEEKYWSGLEYYMAMYIYSRICEELNWKCIVVEDMQKLLAGN